MLVAFFSDFADAEEAVGDMQEAKRLRELSAKVGRSVDKLLWSEEEGDHYVTQLRLDGSKRDMVDYDANFIALAHGIASPERAAKVFKRVDAGHLTHVAPTYVSERYYGELIGLDKVATLTSRPPFKTMCIDRSRPPNLGLAIPCA
jgi:neutral trehalase